MHSRRRRALETRDIRAELVKEALENARCHNITTTSNHALLRPSGDSHPGFPSRRATPESLALRQAAVVTQRLTLPGFFPSLPAISRTRRPCFSTPRTATGSRSFGASAPAAD